MSEYDHTDAGFYDCLSTGLDGDEAFYVEEAQKAGGNVLEIGCGTGRIMIPIAESGVNIVGLDSAPAMLEVARDKIAGLSDETRRRIQIVEDDMRTFQLDQRFDLAIMPYRAFLHMMTVDDQRRALTGIRDQSGRRRSPGFQRVRPQPGDYSGLYGPTPGNAQPHRFHQASGYRPPGHDP